MALSFVVYTVLLLVAIRYGRPMADSLPRTLLLISPMLGFGLMLWAIVRMLGRMDEYMRMRLLENISMGAAITVGLTFTYGFLETAGFPKLSMFTVWCVLALSVAAVQGARCLLKR
jgi:hypothetical protein